MASEIDNDGQQPARLQTPAERLGTYMADVTTPPVPPVQKVYMARLVKFPPLSPEELAEQRSRLTPRYLTWIICVAFVAVADWFFWEQPFGCTLGIFCLLLGGAAYFSLPDKNTVTLPAVMVFVSGTALLTQVSFWGVLLAILSLASMVAISRSGPLKSVREWLFVVCMFLRNGITPSISEICSVHSYKADKESLARHRRNMKNALLIIAFAAVFLTLFLIANPVLVNKASRLIDHIQRWMGDWIFAHIFFWGAVLIITWMCLRFCMRAFNDTNRLSVKLPSFSGSFATQCLVVFNLIFLLQTCTDIFYLWSGQELPDGLTYAQYAQRGAYPLAIAAILAGAFMVFAWSDDREKSRPTPLRIALATLWLAQNLFLMVCAAWRLYLYVSAYSMTQLRFLAGIGMILVAIGFIAIAVRIYLAKSANWLLTVNFSTITLAVIFCAFFNSCGWIAQFNVTHSREICNQGVNLDLSYMENLGPGAIPALMRFAQNTPDKKAAHRASSMIDHLNLVFQCDMENWRYRTLWRSQISKQMKTAVK